MAYYAHPVFVIDIALKRNLINIAILVINFISSCFFALINFTTLIMLHQINI